MGGHARYELATQVGAQREVESFRVGDYEADW